MKRKEGSKFGANMRVAASVLGVGAVSGDGGFQTALSGIYIEMQHDYDVDYLPEVITHSLIRISKYTGTSRYLASCILAWSHMCPDYFSCIFESLMSKRIPSGSYAEGLVVGFFEAVEEYPHPDHDKYLGTWLSTNLKKRTWDQPDCTVSSDIKGRMSQTLSKFFDNIHTDSDQMKQRRELIAGLIEEVKIPEKLEDNAKQNLHEYLIQEMSAKYFLAMSPRGRLEAWKKMVA